MKNPPPFKPPNFAPKRLVMSPADCARLGGVTEEEMHEAWGALPPLVKIENGETLPIWDEESETMDDPVNHPKHYNSHPSGVECIDISEHFPGNVAAAIKYLWRKDDKHPVPLEDLKKAEWYLARELERLAVPPLLQDIRDRMNKVMNKDKGVLGDVLSRLAVTAPPEIQAVKRMLERVRSEVTSQKKDPAP